MSKRVAVEGGWAAPSPSLVPTVAAPAGRSPSLLDLSLLALAGPDHSPLLRSSSSSGSIVPPLGGGALGPQLQLAAPKESPARGSLGLSPVAAAATRNRAMVWVGSATDVFSMAQSDPAASPRTAGAAVIVSAAPTVLRRSVSGSASVNDLTAAASVAGWGAPPRLSTLTAHQPGDSTTAASPLHSTHSPLLTGLKRIGSERTPKLGGAASPALVAAAGNEQLLPPVASLASPLIGPTIFTSARMGAFVPSAASPSSTPALSAIGLLGMSGASSSTAAAAQQQLLMQQQQQQQQQVLQQQQQQQPASLRNPWLQHQHRQLPAVRSVGGLQRAASLQNISTLCGPGHAAATAAAAAAAAASSGQFTDRSTGSNGSAVLHMRPSPTQQLAPPPPLQQAAQRDASIAPARAAVMSLPTQLSANAHLLQLPTTSHQKQQQQPVGSLGRTSSTGQLLPLAATSATPPVSVLPSFGFGLVRGNSTGTMSSATAAGARSAAQARRTGVKLSMTVGGGDPGAATTAQQQAESVPVLVTTRPAPPPRRRQVDAVTELEAQLAAAQLTLERVAAHRWGLWREPACPPLTRVGPDSAAAQAAAARRARRRRAIVNARAAVAASEQQSQLQHGSTVTAAGADLNGIRSDEDDDGEWAARSTGDMDDDDGGHRSTASSVRSGRGGARTRRRGGGRAPACSSRRRSSIASSSGVSRTSIGGRSGRLLTGFASSASADDALRRAVVSGSGGDASMRLGVPTGRRRSVTAAGSAGGGSDSVASEGRSSAVVGEGTSMYAYSAAATNSAVLDTADARRRALAEAASARDNALGVVCARGAGGTTELAASSTVADVQSGDAVDTPYDNDAPPMTAEETAVAAYTLLCSVADTTRNLSATARAMSALSAAVRAFTSFSDVPLDEGQKLVMSSGVMSTNNGATDQSLMAALQLSRDQAAELARRLRDSSLIKHTSELERVLAFLRSMLIPLHPQTKGEARTVNTQNNTAISYCTFPAADIVFEPFRELAQAAAAAAAADEEGVVAGGHVGRTPRGHVSSFVSWAARNASVIAQLPLPTGTPSLPRN